METTETLKETLYRWNKLIREQNVEKASALKEELDALMTDIKDPDLNTTYELFDIRFYLLLEDYRKALDGFADVGSVMALEDHRLKFYYHFFDGILMYGNRRYQEAVENYLKAEPYLLELDDKAEIAEFKYKLASAYHRVSNFGFSLVEASEALPFFEEEKNLKRTANCENLLAVNYKNMGQYKMAEKYYQNAKTNAEKIEDTKGQSTIYHNLGSLYASQNLPETAICYLIKAEQLTSPEQYDLKIRTKFVLARELFKTKKLDEARKHLDIGLDLSIEHRTYEFSHLFKMLQTKYPSKNNRFENVYQNGINYFKDKEMWYYVVEYSEELALHYQEIDMCREANVFFSLAVQARKTINRKGAINS